MYSFVVQGKTKEEAESQLQSIDPGLQRITQPLLFNDDYSGVHLLNPDESMEIIKARNRCKVFIIF